MAESCKPKPALAGAGNRLQKADLRAGIIQPNILNNPLPQVATIRAEVLGTGICEACGITARGSAPVLTLCRLLIAAGHDPRSRLEAWRGSMLAVRVRSIGEAANLRVREDRIEFARWEPPPRARPSPRIAQKGQAATLLAKTILARP